MVKRKCPVCGKYKFTANETKVNKCTCGADLGPELNKAIGEADEKPVVFPQVGEVLESGHMVLAVWKKEYVLAVSENKDNPEPYVTWHLDQNGQPYSGSYFKDAFNAEKQFASLCFKWFDNTDEKVISAINEYEERRRHPCQS